MNVVFLSNYFTHHQQPFSDEMFRFFNDDYRFISTDEMTSERVKLGWEISDLPQYVISKKEFLRDLTSYQNIINTADIAIAGSASYSYIESRMKSGKLFFYYSERLFKKGCSILQYIPRFIKWNFMVKKNQPVFLLCASAYAANDYAKIGLFKKKCFKWGYFPKTFLYENIDFLIKSKKKTSILWVSRFIDWKHPEVPIEIAKRLKRDGYSFTLKLIGNGVLEEKIKQDIINSDLSDFVHVLGSMKPEQVREHMVQSGIFLFTSDRNEGWGAVLNESMNSGCAVVASHAIGSVPFLIKDGKNGLIYESGNLDMLYEKIKYLLDHPEEQRDLGAAAYQTIVTEWNAAVAAERFVALCEALQNGEKYPDLFESGPCSHAEIIKDDWIKNSKNN